MLLSLLAHRDVVRSCRRKRVAHSSALHDNQKRNAVEAVVEEKQRAWMLGRGRLDAGSGGAAGAAAHHGKLQTPSTLQNQHVSYYVVADLPSITCKRQLRWLAQLLSCGCGSLGGSTTDWSHLSKRHDLVN